MKYESPVEENLHWSLDKAKKNKRTIIYIFANGRPNQVPEKFVLTMKDLRNWLQTLEHMANAIDMPEGISKYIFLKYLVVLIIFVGFVLFPEIMCAVLLKSNMVLVMLLSHSVKDLETCNILTVTII